MTAILAAFIGQPVATAFISITDQYITKFHRGAATASYVVANNGTVQNHAAAVLETWLNGSGGSVGNYEVRATVTSGSVTSGTTGSWLSCSTSRTWSVLNSAADNSTLTAVMTVEIRLASSGVVQDSATITLEATSIEPGGGGGGLDGPL